jgi:AAA ATPase-like protein
MRPFPFVGRVRELDRLADELDSSAHQGSRIVIVVGEPGVGKTRLLSEFEAAARRRARCLIGRGSPVGTTIRFPILAEALETQLRDLIPQEIIRVCGRHLHELAEVLPSVSAALGRPSTASGSRLGTFEGLLELLGALASDRPVLLCLNDLHQADPDTWAWINYLGRNPVRAPILVVATTRSEPMGAFPVFRELIGTLLPGRPGGPDGPVSPQQG